MLILGGCVAFGVITGASAGGGRSIATAPTAPFWQGVFGGGDPKEAVEFYRLPAGTGDKLFLDVSPADTERGGFVEVDLFSPDVTDETLGQARATASIRTTTSKEMSSRVMRSGRWVLRIRTTNGARYELFTGIARFTRIFLEGPGAIPARAHPVFRGRVTVARSGRVVLQRRIRRIWTPMATVSLRRGRFAYPARFPGLGTFETRAVFVGDRGLQGSVSKVVRTRVR